MTTKARTTKQEFDDVAKEIDQQAAMLDRISAGKPWREFAYLGVTMLLLLTFLNFDMQNALDKADLHRAFGDIVVFIVILFLFLEVARMRHVRQLKAIIDHLRAQKVAAKPKASK